MQINNQNTNLNNKEPLAESQQPVSTQTINSSPQMQQSQPSINSAPRPTSQDDFQTFIPTKNKPALFSYYFGIFGLIPFFGIPLAIVAVVLGIIGLKKFKQNPTPGAKGHALTGLILGSIELFITILLILLVIIG